MANYSSNSSLKRQDCPENYLEYYQDCSQIKYEHSNCKIEEEYIGRQEDCSKLKYEHFSSEYSSQNSSDSRKNPFNYEIEDDFSEQQELESYSSLRFQTSDHYIQNQSDFYEQTDMQPEDTVKIQSKKQQVKLQYSFYQREQTEQQPNDAYLDPRVKLEQDELQNYVIKRQNNLQYLCKKQQHYQTDTYLTFNYDHDEYYKHFILMTNTQEQAQQEIQYIEEKKKRELQKDMLTVKLEEPFQYSYFNEAHPNQYKDLTQGNRRRSQFCEYNLKLTIEGMHAGDYQVKLVPK